VTLVCIAATVAAAAIAHPRQTRCAPRGATIYAKDRSAEVYQLADQLVFGCATDSRVRVQLGIEELCQPESGHNPGRCPQGVVPPGGRRETSCRSGSSLGCGPIASVRLAGSVVAYDEFRNEGSRQQIHFMSVRSLRSDRMLHHIKLPTVEYAQVEDVQEIVLTPGGATAWVEFNSEPGCSSWGHDGNRCFGTFSIYAVSSSEFRPLALSLAAEPTLNLTGNRLTWTAGLQSSTTTL
jgi:hypothetical protein